MGEHSRGKRDRISAPAPRFAWLTGLLIDGWLWLSLIGFFLFTYGTSLMMYSRWNHKANVGVHPAFHPWAIVVGIATMVISFKKQKGNS